MGAGGGRGRRKERGGERGGVGESLLEGKKNHSQTKRREREYFGREKGGEDKTDSRGKEETDRTEPPKSKHLLSSSLSPNFSSFS
jgi:hypothetical protein